MDVLTHQDLEVLMAERPGPCVSVYLPTHPVGRGTTPEDPATFKSMVTEAARALADRGLRRPDIDALLEPVLALDNNHFWSHQDAGLAVFAAPGFMREYRLPASFPTGSLVADRFHLKPMLPLVAGERCLVLALSQGDIRLLGADRFGVRPVKLRAVPTSLEEALQFDDPEKQLQSRQSGVVGGGRQAASFHGHGAGLDEKDRITRYLRKVDQGLHEVLRHERSPMVLAGVDYLLSIYRSVATYQPLMDDAIEGNPEQISDRDLAERARTITDPWFSAQRDAAAAEYAGVADTDRASDRLDEVVTASLAGRVATLFVPIGVKRWGRMVDRQVVEHDQPESGDIDLLDEAALATWKTDGRVYAVQPEQMPAATDVAAIFRY